MPSISTSSSVVGTGHYDKQLINPQHTCSNICYTEMNKRNLESLASFLPWPGKIQKYGTNLHLLSNKLQEVDSPECPGDFFDHT